MGVCIVKKKLIYYVVYERNGIIEKHNIFEHGGFIEDLKKIKKEYLKEKEVFLSNHDSTSDIVLFDNTYKETKFKEKLISTLKCYFWARTEYEIILTDWPTMITKEEAERIVDEFKKRDHYREAVNLPVEVKVDVYDQVTLNFDLFVDYVWAHLNEF